MTAALLGVGLPLAAPFFTALAALLASHRWGRVAAAPLLACALVADAAAAIAASAVNAALGTPESSLFTWSPLGLYGEDFVVRRGPDVALLGLPMLVLALAGVLLADRRRRWFSGRPEESAIARIGRAAGLFSVAGAVWAIRAGDFVSLYLGIAALVFGSVVLVGSVVGAAAAGRRAAVGSLCGVAFLGTVLVLGRVNGHFVLSALSTAGFGGGAFAGFAVTAAYVSAIPPFHGWLVRSARHAIVPALAAAGAAAGAALLLVAYRTADIGIGWQAELRAAGWIAALVGAGIALTRRRPALALAAATVARLSALFFAASVSTPAALSAALGAALLMGTPLGLLWLTASHPWRTAGPLRGSAPSRSPGFWVNLILLASAAGLPPTVGGLTRAVLAASLTAWPSGDQLLRLPMFVADVAVLIAGGALLWDARYLPPLRGRWGWAIATAVVLALCAPAIAPQYLLNPWLGASSAAAIGTISSPLRIEGPVVPSIPSIVLMLVAAWILFRRLQSREWLPPLGTALLGASALAWNGAGRRWRERGFGSLPGTLAAVAWERLERVTARSLALLRPFEERYYAGAAILIGVAIIFVVGR